MTEDEIINNIDNQIKESEYFKKGFKAGAEYKNRLESKVNELETLLLEFIGYEDEWLLTKAKLKKTNREVLAEIVINQRQLMRELYNKLDNKTKIELKKRVESCIWPIMHNED
ncbi:hypothetical protein MOE81_08405 [Bacillus inaquosorum]|uniref:hypothetical protein n=1 Tax=Bacillus inaquosorum TaxID=483913 RepID=UPI00228022CD|nr:hypothetical protein [Bacillus inaquosorum]MCY9057948.1 hypothetical protein [Bacillus inaquosorum]